MEYAAIIAAISAALKGIVDLGPGIIKLEQDAEPFAIALYNMVKGAKVTQAQLDEGMARIGALSAQLQVPLPPDDGSFE